MVRAHALTVARVTFRSALSMMRPVAFAAALLLGASGAMAQLFPDNEARRSILDLHQKFEAEQAESARRQTATNEQIRRLTEENAQLRRSLLDLQTQIDTLRADTARLVGTNEQLTRGLTETQRQQKAAEAGLDERIKTLQKDGIAPLEERLKKLEPTQVTVDGVTFEAEPREKHDFEAALALFRKGEFESAQQAFAGFITRWIGSGYTPSAFFWLGNAQYASGDYKEAIINYRHLLKQAKDHMRAPEAVLAIANCQVELKEVAAARATLQGLIKDYPKSDAATTARQRLPRLKDAESQGSKPAPKPAASAKPANAPAKPAANKPAPAKKTGV